APAASARAATIHNGQAIVTAAARACQPLLPKSRGLGENAPVPYSQEHIDMAQSPPSYTHTGQRYVLGHGGDYYGIWDRSNPAAPTWSFPRTQDGWAQAWAQFSAVEPQAQPVGSSVAPPAPYAPAPYAPAPYAGAPQPGYAAPPQPVSGAWWLLPIFVGWLGGLIAYFSVRDRDRGKAKAMLWTGIIISVVVFILVYSANRAVIDSLR
ncbi:MAG: hypothetical protein WD770_09465, partial [Actinomycetota bacterium]